MSNSTAVPDLAAALGASLYGLARLADPAAEFAGEGTFLGINCSARERIFFQETLVLCAQATEAWIPTLGVPVLDCPLWLYVDTPVALDIDEEQELLARLKSWKTGVALGFEGVPGGGALFAFGNIALPPQVGTVLGLSLPTLLPASALITFPGGFRVVRVRTTLDQLKGNLFRSAPILELTTPLGPALQGLRMRLYGSIGHEGIDGKTIDLAIDVPIGPGAIVGTGVFRPDSLFDRLLPFPLPPGTEVAAEIELLAGEGGLALQRTSFDFELGEVTLIE